MKDRLTLWDDTLRVIENDAVLADNSNRIGEARNLRVPICSILQELDDPDVDREEAEWEARQVIEAVRPRGKEQLISSNRPTGKTEVKP